MVEGANEVLGPEIVKIILSANNLGILNHEPVQSGVIPVGLFDEFQNELISLLGPAGGRGMAVRIGRSTFRYGLRKYGKTTGLSSLEYRLMPAPQRIRAGLEKMKQVINGEKGKLVEVEELHGRWIWRQWVNEQNPDIPTCYLIMGVLQGFLSWVSGGKFYPINCENDSIKGASYQIISIDKKPLD